MKLTAKNPISGETINVANPAVWIAYLLGFLFLGMVYAIMKVGLSKAESNKILNPLGANYDGQTPAVSTGVRTRRAGVTG